MIKIKLDLKQIERIQDKLRKVKNLRPVLKEIADSLEASTKLRFNEGVDPDGQAWEPLSPAYQAQLQRQGKLAGKRILVASGRLQKSIEAVSDDRQVIVGTNIDYAEKHQEGEGVPQRKFLGISQRDEDQIEKIIEEHLEKD